MAATKRDWPLSLLAPIFAGMALAGGYLLGGAMALGRSDLALAIPTLLAFAFFYAGLAAREGLWRGIAVVGGGWLAAAALPVVWAIAVPADAALLIAPSQIFAYAAATLLALLTAVAVIRWSARWGKLLRWALVGFLIAVWWFGAHVWLGRAYLPVVSREVGRVVVLTSLPLVGWRQPGAAAARSEDPALAALRALSARSVTLADSLADGSLNPGDRLLLAHPHALPPEALIAIDNFVRTGGRAVILADGLSGWPPPHGFGDPRNPPVTSLLTPLLDHWGIALAAPVPGQPEAGERVVRHWGYRLQLHSTGHFERLPENCRGAGGRKGAGPVIAICKIGRGEAVLVADADLLFAPLWQSQPGWARHLRPSDNIEWLAGRLNEPRRGDIWGFRSTWWD